MRVLCSRCGKPVSNDLPVKDIIIKAFVECPECCEAAQEQPKPKGEGPEIVGLVIKDLQARAEVGEKRYGEKLKPFNGRNGLLDAYQEALDLVMYLRQCLYEKHVE